MIEDGFLVNGIEKREGRDMYGRGRVGDKGILVTSINKGYFFVQSYEEG